MPDRVPELMRQWVLARRPRGLAAEDDFRLESAPVPEIGDGEALLKVLYLGVAPVMLRYMTNETSFERPMAIGDVMIGRGVGRVVASRNPGIRVGDIHQAKLGWREYAVIDGSNEHLAYRMRHTDLPLSHGISSLAMSGFTALVGMREIGGVRAGDRVLVSGAAGGVGSQAGFVARALGAEPIVGIAGGPAKCRLLTERLGYSAAVDYRTEDIAARLDALLPDGVDVFFDNVGGALLDEVLGRIRRRARVVICGRIAEYLLTPDQYHRHRNVHRIGLQDAKMEGFFIYMRSLEFEAGRASLGLSTLALAALTGKLLSGWVSDRVDPYRLLRLQMFTMLAGLLGVTFLPHLIWLFLVVTGLGWGSLHTLYNYILITLFGLRDAGKINGSISLAESIGGGLGILMTGLAHDAFGGYPAALTVVCGVMLLGALLTLRLRPGAAVGA